MEKERRNGTEGGRVRRLTEPEKRLCRDLWEEIFSEDSKEFLDYYDRWKYTENECYGIFDGNRLVSMLQLNPYKMQVKPAGADLLRTIPSRYIIAVATRAEYRHRGMMSRLLKESLGRLRTEGVPFAFLMPAAEAIYYPFGFRYFYETNAGELKPGEEPGAGAGALLTLTADLSDLEGIAVFSEKIQAEFFDCYTKRDHRYYETLLAELESEGGRLLLLTEPDGRIAAAVPCWGKDPVEIREILCRPQEKARVLAALSRWFEGSPDGRKPEKISIVGASFELEKKKPVIMGRIADVVSFLELFSAEQPTELFLELSDSFLEENEGLYQWELSQRGSRARRLSPAGSRLLKAEVIHCSVAELFSHLMGGAERIEALRAVRVCRTFQINEIV